MHNDTFELCKDTIRYLTLKGRKHMSPELIPYLQNLSQIVEIKISFFS